MEALVSIILPTYNRASLIGETIESVINQTFQNWELIIVDDGSEDETEALIRDLQNTKLSYHRIDHCGILGRVRNYGIKVAHGDYIAFLDSDDLWRNDKLALQCDLLKKDEIMFTLSNGSHFGELVTLQPPDLPNFTGDLFHSLLVTNQFVVYTPSLLFKRGVFNSIAMINENLKSGSDVDFIYRMAHRFNGSFSSERLVSIRKHANGMSSMLRETAYTEDIEIVNQFYHEGALTKAQHSKIISTYYYKIGLSGLRKLEPKVAVRYFFKYNMEVPINYKGWLRLIQALTRSFIGIIF